MESLYQKDEFKAALKTILDPILEGFKNSQNYDEALEALANAFPKMESEKLEDLLSRAIFVSEAVGITQ